jgi:IstB-like ATP binding protein
MEALKAGYLVRYATLDDLVRDRRHANRLGTLRQKLAHYQRPHLLICDEVGYLPLEPADANRFFQVINRRYTRSSTIVTSNTSASPTGARSSAMRSLPPRSLTASYRTPRSSPSGPSRRLRGRNEICHSSQPRHLRPGEYTFQCLGASD